MKCRGNPLFVEEMTLLLLQKWARGQRKRKKKEEKKNQVRYTGILSRA